MDDPRGITRIDKEVKLASNEYMYCIDRSGMLDGEQLAAIGTDVFRSKDGKTWEKWGRRKLGKMVYKNRTPLEAIKEITEMIRDNSVMDIEMIYHHDPSSSGYDGGFWDIEVIGRWQAEG